MVENWDAPLQLRFDEAAAYIADHARMSIVDRGAVHVGGNLRAMIRGMPPWETEAMTAPESADWHERAIHTVQLIAALGLAVALLRACIRS
jgi:hypothetical protein